MSTCQKPLIFTFIQTGDSCKWIDDSKHFLLEFFDIICESPCQIYYSALPLSPTQSWLKEHYSVELQQVVRPIKGIPDKWKACSRTVLFDGYPDALSFSYKDNIIAIGLQNSEIILFNTVTGSKTATLSGHESWVTSLVFSSDGSLLVSGSMDTTIKLWDMQTGGVIKTFCGHTSFVWSVSISADCTRIASASDDETICLWDIQTGECNLFTTLQGELSHVRFSPLNTAYLTTICNSKVQWWDINGQQIRPTCNGFNIAFSSDYAQFAICDEDAVTICTSVSGVIITKLCWHNDDQFPEQCCFSPDGRLIAAFCVKTAYIWDISNSKPSLVGKFTVDYRRIFSIIFISPYVLVSISKSKSCDQTDMGSVEYWQVSELSTHPVSSAISVVSFCPSFIVFVSLQASQGIAISGDTAGVLKIWDISNGICKTTIQTPATQPLSGDAMLINGRLIFIWISTRELPPSDVRYKIGQTFIWDSAKDELHPLHFPSATHTRISEDGSRIFIQRHNKIQAMSMWTWESVGEVEWEENSGYYLSPFCANSSKVWVQSQKSQQFPTRGWDFGISGSPPIQVSNAFPERPQLELIGVEWDTIPSTVKDTVTGKEVFKLPCKTSKLQDVRWDGRYLVAGYKNGEVLILDFCHFLSL